MADNPPAGTPQIYPRLAYRDPGAAVVWLSRAFGFTEREEERLEIPPGELLLTELQLGAGIIMVARADGHGLQSPASLGGMNQMVIAYVDEIDSHLSQAIEAGAEIVMPLEDKPWGDRRYEALDLEGQRWCVLEHVRDVPPEEWKKEVGG